MKVPCEHAIWYILPQIRADIAKRLVKGGMNQKEAAEKLGVTAAAVSQYLNSKRAATARQDKEYIKAIEDAVERIREGGSETTISKTLCDCCNACRRG
jgi:uncharacterized protein